MENNPGTTKVITNVKRKLHSPSIFEAPYPVRDDRKNPKTMITFVREEAELRSSAGAFSVTQSGGVAVENPTEKPTSNLRRIGRKGSEQRPKPMSPLGKDRESVFGQYNPQIDQLGRHRKLDRSCSPCSKEIAKAQE